MGKSRRGHKEINREQKLSNENKRLKKELAHLRKQISRLDGDRFETLRQIAVEEENQGFQEVQNSKPNMELLKKEWACRKSPCTGFLEIVLYPKLGKTWYYRKCNSCQNRTTGKRYEESVKGIVKNG